jgi:hypothetical protein
MLEGCCSIHLNYGRSSTLIRPALILVDVGTSTGPTEARNVLAQRSAVLLDPEFHHILAPADESPAA